MDDNVSVFGKKYYCSVAINSNKKIHHLRLKTIMDYTISRSEKKRQAKAVEQLAKELVDLSENDIGKLPCDDFLRAEILAAKPLKSGARKRQIKYIAKELRNSSAEPLLAYLEKSKGSHLKKVGEFHELERLRDAILTEAIEARREAQEAGERLNEQWDSATVNTALEKFPDLDAPAIKKSALRYAANRKPAHSREIFRMLKAAMDRQRFQSAR